MNAHQFVHPGSLQAALVIKEVKPAWSPKSKAPKSRWFVGRTFGGTFFAASAAEVRFKYLQFVLKRRRHTLATAGLPVTEDGSLPSFFDTYGFGAGQKVRFHPVPGGFDDGYLYTVSMTGYQSDGQPVAWLSGRSGCIPLSQLSHIEQRGA